MIASCLLRTLIDGRRRQMATMSPTLYGDSDTSSGFPPFYARNKAQGPTFQIPSDDPISKYAKISPAPQTHTLGNGNDFWGGVSSKIETVTMQYR